MRTITSLALLGVLIFVTFHVFNLSGKAYSDLIDRSKENLSKHYEDKVMESVDESKVTDFTVTDKSFNRRTGRYATGTAYNLTLEKGNKEFYVEVPESVYSKIEKDSNVPINDSALDRHEVLIYKNEDNENVVLQVIGSSE